MMNGNINAYINRMSELLNLYKNEKTIRQSSFYKQVREFLYNLIEHQIKSVEGSEVMEAFERILRTHRKIYGEWTPNIEEILEWEGLECKEIDIIKSYIQQQTQREKELYASISNFIYEWRHVKNCKDLNDVCSKYINNNFKSILKQLAGEDDE